MLNIKFLGAAQNVTGSCYLLNYKSLNFLVDCGMFQEVELRELNQKPFDFVPSNIDFVLLTHAHIDHSGLLPKLFKEGFNGTIYCTTPTKEILEFILMDAAKIQEQNERNFGIPALYTVQDAEYCLGKIKPINFDNEFHIGELFVNFRKASHILGAASIEIRNDRKSICFSGDLGRQNPPILKSYSDFNSKQNYIVMESLYGDRIHNNINDSLQKLSTIINNTLARDGNVIIPVFAIQRSQEMMFHLEYMRRNGLISNNVQIIFDTPLGEKIFQIYLNNTQYFNGEINNISDPYGISKNVTFVHSNKASIKLKKSRGKIILAGGGMLDGGRSLNHLKSFASDSNSSLVIVGYQAEGTLGRTILTKPKSITLGDKDYKLNIDICEVYGFSAHGDQADLKWWVERFDKSVLDTLFLTHSNLEQSKVFGSTINYGNISIPKRDDVVTLDF